MRKTAAAAVLAAGLALAAAACNSGQVPLSRACRAAQAREEAVAASTRWAAARSSQFPFNQMYLDDVKQEGRALRAMKAAGCPPGTKVAGPY